MKHLKALFEAVKWDKEDIEDAFIKLEDFGFDVKVHKHWVEFDEISFSEVGMSSSEPAAESAFLKKKLEDLWKRYSSGWASCRASASQFMSPRLIDFCSYDFLDSSPEKRVIYFDQVRGPCPPSLQRNELFFNYKCFVVETEPTDGLLSRLSVLNDLKVEELSNLVSDLDRSGDYMKNLINDIELVKKSWNDYHQKFEKNLAEFNQLTQQLIKTYSTLYNKLKDQFYIFVHGLNMNEEFQLNLQIKWLLISKTDH